MQQQEDPMITIHQEFIWSFSKHEDGILSMEAEDDDDNNEVLARSPSAPNVNIPQHMPDLNLDEIDQHEEYNHFFNRESIPTKPKGILWVGMQFMIKDEYTFAIQEFGIKENVGYKTDKSDQSQLTVYCPNGCDWYCRVHFSKKAKIWEIKNTRRFTSMCDC